jgi:putative hemolysin
MTTLALSALIDSAPRWLSGLLRYWTELSNGIEEARAMALRYQVLSALSDRELAARGLRRQDIPRAVLGGFRGV